MILPSWGKVQLDAEVGTSSVTLKGLAMEGLGHVLQIISHVTMIMIFASLQLCSHSIHHYHQHSPSLESTHPSAVIG